MQEMNDVTDLYVEAPQGETEDDEDIEHHRCILCNIHHAMLLFCTQIWFSFVTMSFCIYKLSNTSDPAIISIYLPLLSSIVTLWLPMPQIKTTK